ncbi:MAG: hypothetical protein IPL56_04995 [Saprospiraceae bacterium]|jgi:hypothetical protein|nr:hypothetical protein [Saprospiraceae bacterium]
MQKPDWRYIENFVDPDLFQKAYDLVEQYGDQVKLTKGELGLYTLEWSDSTEELSTEISFGRKYIKKSNCTCGAAGKKICIHLIAAIILHRRVTEKDQDLTPASRETMLPSRISIPTILQQIPKEDLDRFLQRYARMNKQFAQAVKLHFASRIQVNSPQQKYHDLIKSMTRLTPNSMGKIAKHALQSLFWISEELLLQVDDLIAMENPIEAFAICIELMEKFHSIYRKMELYFGEFEKYWILIHQKLKSILDMRLAPDFRAEVEQKLTELFSDPAYPMIHSPHNLYELLIYKSDLDTQVKIHEYIIKKIARKELNPIPLLALVKTAMKLQQESMLYQAFEINSDYSRWLSTMDLLNNQQRDSAKTLGKWLTKIAPDEFWKNKILDRIWTLFPDEPSSIKYALTLLEKNAEEKYLKYLTEHKISKDLIVKSLTQSKHPKSKLLLANYFIEEGQTEEALVILSDHLSLDLLKSYTQRLIVIAPEWLEQGYKKIFTQYLETHVGPTPAVKIQNILAYLHMAKAHSLADQLQKWLKKTFQDHTSLSERL